MELRQSRYSPEPLVNLRSAPRLRKLQAKGRPPLRRCPDDFDIIFVEIGRLDCESWYRARRTTINRWLAERGKIRLITLRAAYVRHLRNQNGEPPCKVVEPLCDKPAVDPVLARFAADFLRSVRNGGWIVSSTGQGDWWVGSVRRSAGDMVAMAQRKGFDVAAVQASLEAMR